jgi:hypothetical protein
VNLEGKAAVNKTKSSSFFLKVKFFKENEILRNVGYSMEKPFP